MLKKCSSSVIARRWFLRGGKFVWNFKQQACVFRDSVCCSGLRGKEWGRWGPREGRSPLWVHSETNQSPCVVCEIINTSAAFVSVKVFFDPLVTVGTSIRSFLRPSPKNGVLSNSRYAVQSEGNTCSIHAISVVPRVGSGTTVTLLCFVRLQIEDGCCED